MKFLNKKPIVLFDIDHTLFDTEKFKASSFKTYCLYEEVLEILKKLSKIADLGIFSQGEIGFQEAKLRNTKIEDFFKRKHLNILENKELEFSDVLNKYKDYKIFLVDDHLGVLRLAKKIMPSIIAIWIKRGPHAEKQKKIDGFDPDNTILNLKELVCIIDSNMLIYAKKS